MQNKIIAIDYDDTISFNVEAWSQIIALFASHGAIVYIVTYRESTCFSDMVLDIKGVKDVIFTNTMGKKQYCEEIAGIEVDIWIDDTPESIIWSAKDLVRNLRIK